MRIKMIAGSIIAIIMPRAVISSRGTRESSPNTTLPGIASCLRGCRRESIAAATYRRVGKKEYSRFPRQWNSNLLRYRAVTAVGT